jgi:peptidoglycan/xylan/chitin deacetylase (PgdA/CDA1 family)
VRGAILITFLAATSAHAAPPKDTEAPELLFTFDDGPTVQYTPRILDTLDQHGVKAVFFVLGQRLQGNGPAVQKSREILRDELRRGHAVGNHTIHHYFLCGHFYIKQAWQEIEGNAKIIEEVIGQRPDLFRSPYGAHCKQLNGIIAGLGIKNTLWDIDPDDWRNKTGPMVESYVEKQLMRLKGRAIILFHDRLQATADALPHILDWIDKENARRTAAGQAPIKIINYAYLLPERKLVPPFLDALARVLVDLANKPSQSTIRLWPGTGPPLAWPPGQV